MIKNIWNVILLNIIYGILAGFIAILINVLISVIYMKSFQELIDIELFSLVLIPYFFIPFFICFIPQILFKVIIYLLNKIIKINIGFVLLNIISIIISIISSVYWYFNIPGWSPGTIITFIIYYYYFYLPVIISGIIFININYIIKYKYNK